MKENVSSGWKPGAPCPNWSSPSLPLSFPELPGLEPFINGGQDSVFSFETPEAIALDIQAYFSGKVGRAREADGAELEESTKSS